MSVERLREAHRRGNVDGDVDGGNHFDVSPDASLDCLTCWAVFRIEELERIERALTESSERDWATIYAERRIIEMKDRHIAENAKFYSDVNETMTDIIVGLRARLAEFAGKGENAQSEPQRG